MVPLLVWTLIPFVGAVAGGDLVAARLSPSLQAVVGRGQGGTGGP